MNKCIACKFYDSSVDACNADEACYTDGYNKGQADKLAEILKIVRSEEFKASWVNAKGVEFGEFVAKQLGATD